jgi:1-acyl-sn-glycerol-3-phosphate acyltransferase
MGSASAPLLSRRLAGRAVRVVKRRTASVRTVVARSGFPYRAPTIPGSVDVPREPKKVGPNFETEWARRPMAKAARRVIVSGPMRALVKGLANPEIVGVDRLHDLAVRDVAPPLIFVANHQSHLDAPLMITSIPSPWREKLFVVAAADYFFRTRVTGVASALALGAIPIDRSTVSRKSSDLAAELIADGWSMVIFPEGGRSPDGWGQSFKGGAAFLAQKTGAPIVPVHIDGAGSILGKGMNRPKPGSTKVTFGAPLTMGADENVRRFNERIERAVAVLGDESITDWYTARLRAARGSTPSLTGPEYNGWRRAWALTEHRARGKAGQRRRQKRTWPK